MTFNQLVDFIMNEMNHYMITSKNKNGSMDYYVIKRRDLNSKEN